MSTTWEEGLLYSFGGEKPSGALCAHSNITKSQKLLKQVDFLQWKSDDNVREIKVMRKYHIQKREDYQAYNRLCGSIRSFIHRLEQLPPKDPFRAKYESLLLAKLTDIGLIDDGLKIADLSAKTTVSAFCRRRLPVVMSRIKMSETVRMAVQYVEQGHVRVGPDTVTDPAFLVTRNMQDFVTWVDSSKLKRTIATYNDELDDYDLLS